MPILIIARLTLFEAIRRRLVMAVVLLTPIVVGCTAWGFSRLAELSDNSGQRLAQSELTLNYALFVILIAFMFSVVLAVGAIFLAAPAIGADIDSGLLLALLPRPLRRGWLLLGRWLGLAMLLAGYAVVTGTLELLIIDRVVGYMPPHPAIAVAYIAAQSIILLTLALLGSTRLAPMTCGIIGVVLYGVTWIVGIAQMIGATFHNEAIVTAGTIVSLAIPSDQLWRGAVYNLEPAVIRAAGLRVNPLAVSGQPSTAFMIWVALWLAAVLGLAARSLSSRDL